ncbi:P-loop containing nucleoside triphosphate hydrolase protein [Gigaspora rosea]|uniref:ATP-dependent RNA helicase DBP9 n=1 Tax=Gigaspora rosea TaxID=44941 RepID=A0A397UI88_9GLOM|nr:P-loop containing nucleoside triphosphate hydrolase protein [Gigaspora rosea]
MIFNELDPRISRALSKLNFHKPTLIQAEAIPLALAGKDILARAKTGSGKTAAYCLPVIQKILTIKEAIPETSPDRAAIRSLILVPTRELAEQVTKHINDFLIYCSKEIKVVNIANTTPVQLQRPILSELPDIIVATPSRALAHLDSQNIVVHDTLDSLVIDEADLVLSYGYEVDIQKILTHLPKIFQCFLMSATLTKNVENLKQLLLRNPAILTLHDEKDEINLTQYCVRCSEVDKFLLIYVILKLRLIKGKCILFVNDIDRCYRLKLFLEQFSIKTCVLNSELPLNSRYHIVQEFNKGIYDYIVATDENDLKADNDTDDETIEEHDETKTSDKKRDKTRLRKKDKEYGSSRGIDFINVTAVINFDFPTSAKSYIHRVGRTARASQKGMSLSFVVPKELAGKHKIVSCPSAKHDEEVYAKVEKQQSLAGATLRPYFFDMKQVEGFRYRVEDAMKAVTRTAIKEARLKDIRSEILNSEILKTHFEDNPNDLKALRHDTIIHPKRVQQHMKHVPSYLMPKIATPAANASADSDPVNGESAESNEYIPFRKKSTNERYHGKKLFKGKFGPKKRKNDPLKTFKLDSTPSKRKKTQ